MCERKKIMSRNNNVVEKTHKNQRMLYGVAAGSIIGAIISRLTDTTTALAICISVGMLLGLAIGSSIKKDKSNKE